MYYEGKTASREIVAVYIEPAGLKIVKKNGVSEWWPFEAITHSQGFHIGDPLHLVYTLENHKSIVVEDSNFIAALINYAPDYAKIFRSPITKSKLLWTTIYSALGLLILIPILYLWVLPKFSDITASHIPVNWEEQLGEAYVEVLAPDNELCGNDNLKNKLQEILNTLTSTIPESQYTYKIRVVDDPTVNAFALPGGNVLVYRGLIEKMNSSEEIAGVLAHEIQHVEQKHGMKSIVHQLSFKVLIAMMVGDSEGVGQFLDAAGMLGTLSYGRDAEREADLMGMNMLHNAKIDPQGMVIFSQQSKSNMEISPIPLNISQLIQELVIEFNI